jgi:uncharacterized coiled-coil protein SlyX
VLRIEERVAFVEGRLVEQAALFADLRASIASLEQQMTRRFEHVEARLDRFDSSQSTNFRWIVGIQITTLIAVLAAFAAR